MKGPHKASYDEAKQLLANQKLNLSYINSKQHQQVNAALHDPEIYKGNKLQKLTAQIDDLQKQLEQLIQEEKYKALVSIEELKQKLSGFEEFNALAPEQQQQLLKPFDETAEDLKQQSLIAVIRDDLRRFEDESYSVLVQKLMMWSQPKPEPQPAQKSGAESSSVKNEDGDDSENINGRKEVKEPEPQTIETISARYIKVSYNKPWLASEADVVDYLEKYKTVLLDAIKAGKHVQL